MRTRTRGKKKSAEYGFAFWIVIVLNVLRLAAGILVRRLRGANNRDTGIQFDVRECREPQITLCYMMVDMHTNVGRKNWIMSTYGIPCDYLAIEHGIKSMISSHRHLPSKCPPSIPKHEMIPDLDRNDIQVIYIVSMLPIVLCT